MNQSIDDLGERAAARLRDAVATHVGQKPAREVRRSAPGGLIAVGLVVIAVAGVLAGVTRGGESKVETVPPAAKTFERVNEVPEAPVTGGEDEGTVSAESPVVQTPGAPRPGANRGGGSAAGAGGSSAPPPVNGGFEPSSTELGWPHSCEATGQIYEIRPGEVNPPTQWCGSAYGGSLDPGGRPLRVTLCRDAQAGDATLRFPFRQETDFVVIDSNRREVWRWSRARPVVHAAHTRPMRAGLCVEWKILWSEVSNDGQPLPPGNYYLRATVVADEMNGEWWEHTQAMQVGGGPPPDGNA